MTALLYQGSPQPLCQLLTLADSTDRHTSAAHHLGGWEAVPMQPRISGSHSNGCISGTSYPLQALAVHLAERDLWWKVACALMQSTCSDQKPSTFVHGGLRAFNAAAAQPSAIHRAQSVARKVEQKQLL